MRGETPVTLHFKEKEFVRSETFPDIAAKIELTSEDIQNLFCLVSTILEPERVYSDKETHVLQGKRSNELYDALIKAGFSPSSTSKHFFRNPFDCAIDFQKKVYRMEGNKRVLDITLSRIATICAFYWIFHNCSYAFGLMYYQEPDDPNKIGFIHIQAITPGKPTGRHFIKRIGG